MFYLLSGIQPFKAGSHNDIYEKVKMGKFNLASTEWKNVSHHAKAMVKKLLTYNADQRLTAEQALQEEWIKMNTECDPQLTQKIFHEPLLQDLTMNVQKIHVRPEKMGLIIQISQKLQQAVLTYFVNYMYKDEDKAKLEKIFNAFDKNQDGELDF